MEKTQKPSEKVNGYLWYSPTGNSISSQNKWTTALYSNKEKQSNVMVNERAPKYNIQCIILLLKLKIALQENHTEGKQEHR